MYRLTNEQRLQIIEFYYQNACSVKKVDRALLPFYAQFNRSTKASIRDNINKFRNKLTLLDIKLSTRSVRIEEHIAAVSVSVNEDNYQLSMRHCLLPLLSNVENFAEGFSFLKYSWCKS